MSLGALIVHNEGFIDNVFFKELKTDREEIHMMMRKAQSAVVSNNRFRISRAPPSTIICFHE
jgi:hypothetical protein